MSVFSKKFYCWFWNQYSIDLKQLKKYFNVPKYKKWSRKHRRIFSQLRHWIQLPCEWQWKRHVFKRYKLNDKHAEWEIWKKKSWVLHNLVCRNGVLRICKLFFVYLLRLYTHVLTVWLYLRGKWQAASYFEVCGHKVW